MTSKSQLARMRAGFNGKKYVTVKSFLVEPLLATTYRYALMKSAIGEMRNDDPQLPGTPSKYGDTLMETLLELSCPKIETVTGLELFPTYSFFRVYKNGDVLDPHTDRRSCEISVSVTLGDRGEKPWPLWFRDGELVTSVEVRPGDAVVYRGRDLTHWRESFDGEHQAQVFLHYVDRNGPYAEFRFDKRAGLGVRPGSWANQKPVPDVARCPKGALFRRNPKVTETAVADDVFLVNPDNQSIFHLNAVGAALWRLLAKPIGVEQAVAILHEAFPDVSGDVIERDVAALMDDLSARGLIVGAE